MKKVIFWDFDGTLVYPNTRFVDALDSALKQFGYNIDKGVLSNYLQKIYPWNNYNDTYPNERDKWWDDFLNKLNLFYSENGVDIKDIIKINDSFKNIIINENTYVIYPDAKTVLSKCIGLGYENYLLSNNFPELTNFINDFGLNKYFSGLVISSHVGYEKPRKELFDYAKSIANCKYGIMIGDNPIADIVAGKENGLKTVLVHNQSPSVADYTFESLTEILKIL